MAKKREPLNLDDTIDLDEVANQRSLNKTSMDKATIAAVAESAGFQSRAPSRTRRRRRRSPYTNQQLIRVRPEIKELFQDLGYHFDVPDHTTFERALLALLEKEELSDFLDKFKDITKLP